MTGLRDIKEYCRDWKAGLRNRLDGAGASLTIVQVGDVEASNRYVRNKIKDCEEVGIAAKVVKLSEDIDKAAFLTAITAAVNEKPTGLIVQLPLPAQLQDVAFAHLIPAEMDVDGFRHDSWHDPCTPGGIVKYLQGCGFQFRGAHCVVIGRSDIVGKPLARMLTDRDATVTLCHSKTKNLHEHIYHCDLIICAVGKAKFLNCYPIYVPVVDVGINFDENGKLVGDCFNTEGRMVTPVPGGVGLLTRCQLMENIAQALEV